MSMNLTNKISIIGLIVVLSISNSVSQNLSLEQKKECILSCETLTRMEYSGEFNRLDAEGILVEKYNNGEIPVFYPNFQSGDIQGKLRQNSLDEINYRLFNGMNIDHPSMVNLIKQTDFNLIKELERGGEREQLEREVPIDRYKLGNIEHTINIWCLFLQGFYKGDLILEGAIKNNRLPIHQQNLEAGYYEEVFQNEKLTTFYQGLEAQLTGQEKKDIIVNKPRNLFDEHKGGAFNELYNLIESGELELIVKLLKGKACQIYQPPPPPPPSCIVTKQNSNELTLYNEDGTVYSNAKQYYSEGGRVKQSQAFDLEANEVLATQTLYDAYGVAVGKTLVAPINDDKFCYYSDFLLDHNGEKFDYNDFNTNKVDNSEAGSIGWYYSNNNDGTTHTDITEKYAPASGNPFSLAQAYDEPTGRLKKQTVAGTHRRIGSGKESKVMYINNPSELQYVYGTNKSHILAYEGDATLNAKYNEHVKTSKVVTITPDNKASIAYYGSDGELLATALSGQGNNCRTMQATSRFYLADKRYIDIHTSNVNNISINKPHLTSCGAYSGTSSTATTYTIEDIGRNRTYTEGTDFDIINGKIVFTGVSPSGFLRIKHSYVNAYRSSVSGSCLSGIYHRNITVEYELDYSNWTVNYYDMNNRLVKMIPPNGIDCSFDPIGSNVTESYNIGNPSPKDEEIFMNKPSADYNIFSGTFGFNFELNDFITSGPGGIFITTNPNGDGFKKATGLQRADENRRGLGTVEPQFYKNIDENDYHKITGGKMEGTFQVRIWDGATVRKTHTYTGGIDVNLYYDKTDYSYYSFNYGNYDFFAFSFDSREEGWIPTKIDIRTISPVEVVGLNSVYTNDLITDNTFSKKVAEPYVAGSGLWIFGAEPTHTIAIDYEYNDMGLLKSKSSIDEGTTQFVYRKDGKVRFSQNSQQQIDGKVSYVSYDNASRVIEVGQFNDDYSPYSFGNFYRRENKSAAIISLMDGALDNESLFQSSATLSPVLKITYDSKDATLPLSGYNQRFTLGRISKVENDNATYWYSYNEEGAIEWYISEIDGLPAKSFDYTYDKVSGKLFAFDYQKGTPSERFVHHYNYDRNNRLISVQSSLDGSSKQEEIELEYYTHGPLKRVEIANNLQGVDYVYTIEGWLKTINGGEDDPGEDGTTTGQDIFSNTLSYYRNDYVKNDIVFGVGGEDQASQNVNGTPNYVSDPDLITSSYDGNIMRQVWANNSNPSYTGYNYTYDQKNQLLEAEDGFVWGIGDEINGVPFTSFSTTNKFKVDNISYDEHGNIISLRRTDNTSSVTDDLTYNYQSGTNKLLSVYNNGNILKSYVYNALGQSIEDVEYNADGTEKNHFYIDYNASKLVDAIYHDAVRTQPVVKFYYDPSGRRVKKESFDVSGGTYNLVETFYYVKTSAGTEISMYIEDAASGVISQREISIAGNVGKLYRDGANNDYTYYLRDHIGNVRATVHRTAGNSGALTPLSFANYYPFGMKHPGVGIQHSFGERQGYQGVFSEKDKETGYNAFQLRMYDSRIARWISPDPYGQYWGSYNGMGNNPVNGIDRNGGYKTKTGAWLASVTHGGGKVYQATDAAHEDEWYYEGDPSSSGYNDPDYAGGVLVPGPSRQFGSPSTGPSVLDPDWGEGADPLGYASENIARPAVNNIMLVSSTLGYGFAYAGNRIIRLDFREGRSPNDIAKFKPYTFGEGWVIEGRDDLLSDNLSKEQGAEIIQATVGVIITPMNPISTPNAAINFLGNQVVKTSINQSVKATLNY